jgi:hypothetical protein
VSEDRDEQGYTPSDAQQNQGRDTFRRGSNNNRQFINCPTCPELKRKIDRIDIALLGADGTGMTSGIVMALTQLKSNMNANEDVTASWVRTFRPIVTFVVGSLVTAGVTYLFWILH